MQIEQSTLKTTASGICTVEDGIIYEINSIYGQKNRIGVTDSKYNELKTLSESYYDKLVELGAITPPKTPEQIQAENMQLMNSMLEQMKAMQAEMEVLKNECKSTSAATQYEPAEHAETIPSVGASTKSSKRGK